MVTIPNPPVMGGEGSESVVYKVEKDYILNTSGSGTIKDLEFQFYLLDNWDGWTDQKIISEEISTTRETISTHSTSENRYAVADIPKLKGETETTISITQIVKVTSIDLNIQPKEVEGTIPKEIKSKYTTPVEHLWQSDNPKIEEKAEELTGDTNNYYYKAKSILEWVEEHLSYQEYEDSFSALRAFERERADCTGYSNLFIALARASGIPAKAVSGYLASSGMDESGSNGLSGAGHQWAIIYLPSVGWTPVDLTYNKPRWLFGELSNLHISEMVSDGSNWVGDSDISIPRGKYSYTAVGDVHLEASRESSTLEKEVGVSSDVIANEGMGEKDLRYTVKVKNTGIQDISNVRVELELDNQFSLNSSEKTIGSINSGMENQVYFDVAVDGSVENSQGTAVISYKAGEYGTFVTREKTPIVTIHPPSQPYKLPQLPIPLEQLVIISVIIGGIIIGVSVLLRR